MRSLTSVVFMALLLSVACSPDPRKVRITEANKDKILVEIKDMKGLTVEEARMLTAYNVRQALGKTFGGTGTSAVGKTVGDVIQEQRSFEAEAKTKEEERSRLAAEAKAKEDAMAAELRKTIELTVFDKTFVPADPSERRYSGYIRVKFAYQNNSQKDVRAFTGGVRFTDLFGEEILVTRITIQNPIKAGSKGTWVGDIEYNQFKRDHQKLQAAELKDMKFQWLPETILFLDGSKLGGEQVASP